MHMNERVMANRAKADLVKELISFAPLLLCLALPLESVQAAPYSIWPATSTPGLADSGPDSAGELGVKFQSDVAGTITGIRFYKATANTGTHVGNLWSSAGTLLGSITFSNETASGWQQMLLATPVAITSNTVYVASYHCTIGHYSADLNYFTSKGADNPPLHALTNGVSGGDGVYTYGTGSGGTSNAVCGGASTRKATSNSATMSWTAGTGAYWAIAAVPINPSADYTAPTVDVAKADGQADPTGTGPIHFTATFNEAVEGFGDSDVTLSGDALATTTAVTDSGDHKTYDIAVTGMATAGDVTVAIPAAAAQDLAGNASLASSGSATVSYDNVVFDMH